MATNYVLITGPAGSGKTTLAHYFKEHGKNAIDADLSGIGVMLDSDGREVQIPPNVNREVNKWAEEQNRGLAWNWNGNRLKDLLARRTEVYLFGGAANTFEFAALFDKCYYLDASKELVAQRLDRRLASGESYHDYGNTEK